MFKNVVLASLFFLAAGCEGTGDAPVTDATVGGPTCQISITKNGRSPDPCQVGSCNSPAITVAMSAGRFLLPEQEGTYRGTCQAGCFDHVEGGAAVYQSEGKLCEGNGAVCGTVSISGAEFPLCANNDLFKCADAACNELPKKAVAGDSCELVIGAEVMVDPCSFGGLTCGSPEIESAYSAPLGTPRAYHGSCIAGCFDAGTNATVAAGNKCSNGALCRVSSVGDGTRTYDKVYLCRD